MAVSGLIQPKSTKTQPVVYGIKCVEFQPPYFTLGTRCVPVQLVRFYNDTSGIVVIRVSLLAFSIHHYVLLIVIVIVLCNVKKKN